MPTVRRRNCLEPGEEDAVGDLAGGELVLGVVCCRCQLTARVIDVQDRREPMVLRDSDCVVGEGGEGEVVDMVVQLLWEILEGSPERV